MINCIKLFVPIAANTKVAETASYLKFPTYFCFKFENLTTKQKKTYFKLHVGRVYKFCHKRLDETKVLSCLTVHRNIGGVSKGYNQHER